MTSNLKPYPHYKPSGVEWLGDVPAHWEVLRLKYLLSECSTRSIDGSEQLLSVSQYTGVTERKQAEGKNEVDTRAESLVGYKCVEANDLVVNIMLAWNGSLGISRFCGIVSPSYCVYRFKTDVQPWYFHFLLRSPTYKARIRAISTGIVESRLRMYTDDLYCLEVPLPPLAEQAAIVRYLDHTDGRIRRYLRSRERLIELLKEYRQAVIHETVTQGLDPDVPLKPSGVEWIGDIPAHWEVRRLKHWVRINEAMLPETTDPDFEFRYLEIGVVGTGVLVEEPATIRFAHAPSRARRIVKSGDTIISTVRTYLKAVWFAEEVNDALICSTGFAVLTPRRATVPKFVSYAVQDHAFTDRVTAESVGIAYPAIAESRFRSFHVCVPPLAEQTAIAAYLDKQTAAISAAMARAQREIDLLSEYRMRLIADVVTGQVDVREVAESSHLGQGDSTK